MANDKLFYIAAKAFIENERGEILLFHAGLAPWRVIKESYWDLPGGRIQSGQSALDALKLEIKEETGVEAMGKPELMTTVISNHDISIDVDRELGLALMVYKVAIPAGSKIVMSKEHIDFDWLNKHEAAKRLAHKYPKEFTDLLVSS